MKNIDFSDYETAFAYKSKKALKRSAILFRWFQKAWFVKLMPNLLKMALKLRLPVKRLAKKWAFDHFCGGETLEECNSTALILWQYKVASILDYSVEGVDDEKQFEYNKNEIARTILNAADKEYFPFAVFKVSGLISHRVLEKVNANLELNTAEQDEFLQGKHRFESLCQLANDNDIRLYIDAEESWIQNAIDNMVIEMSKKFNQQKVVIYNTLQMYRTDRLDFFEACLLDAKENNYYLGLKVVRGAYMEKERARAKKMGYPSPIQPNKQATDSAYNEVLKRCVENAEFLEICAGTHNEESCKLLVNLMHDNYYELSNTRFWFSQLYGMSDNLSFILAQNQCNVAKYLPYGPLESTLPYLSRRANENTSVQGQAGREYIMLSTELKRRMNLRTPDQQYDYNK